MNLEYRINIDRIGVREAKEGGIRVFRCLEVSDRTGHSRMLYIRSDHKIREFEWQSKTHERHYAQRILDVFASFPSLMEFN